VEGISTLVREVRAELLRVVWPTGRQTVNYTGFVVLMVAITTLVSVALDTVFNGLLSVFHL
jgi:preprotein translocase subunit SecE